MSSIANKKTKALRMIKESENVDEKVLTLEKPITAEVWEYLEEQVELLVNSKVRTLKTLIVPNEKAPEGANSINGAHDVLFMEAVKRLLSVVKTDEYGYIENNIMQLAA